MSEIENYKQSCLRITKRLEAFLRNLKELRSGLERETYHPKDYHKCLFLNLQEAASLLNKDEEDLARTFSFLGLPKIHIDGSPLYTLSDVLRFVQNTIDHSFGDSDQSQNTVN